MILKRFSIQLLLWAIIIAGALNSPANDFNRSSYTSERFQAEALRDSSKLLKKLAELSVKQKMKMELGKAIFTPFIAPSYSPELAWLISAGGLITFKTDPTDKNLMRSSIPLSIGYSTNGSVTASVRGFIYGKKDKYHLSGEFSFKDMPDHYWGVGYENGRSTPRPDSTQYHRSWYQLKGSYVYKLLPKIYSGLFLDINQTIASELNPHMRKDPNVMNYGRGIRNIGIGISAQYDSRDLAVNAYKGMLLDLSLVSYNKFMGGENRFCSINLDFRKFIPLNQPRHTLAFHFKATQTFGEVPWSDMALLGTPFDLRSYTWGRYRDKAMALGIVEYRHMFNAKPGSSNFANKHGFVTWIGTGSLAPKLSQLKKSLPSAGIGYRLETQTRMNFRVDFGVGKNSSGLYITFNEAF